MDEKLSIRKYNGKNFQIWKGQMMAMLLAKEIYEPIIEDCPEDSVKKASWQKSENLARAYLLGALDDKHAELVIHLPTSRLIWQKLCNVYDMQAQTNEAIIQTDFFSLKLRPNETISDFISRSTSMAEQLKSLGGNIDDSLIAARIISGLPPRFSAFISTWNGTEKTMRTLTNLEARLVSEEQMLKRFNDEDSLALFSKSHKKNNRSNIQSYNRQQQPAKIKVSKDQCLFCKKTGHWKIDCPDRKKQFKRTNIRSSFEASAIVAECNTIEKVGQDDFWWFDSGCSEHMSNDPSSFISYKKLDVPKQVRFGNNDTAAGIGVGDIMATSTLSNGSTRNLIIKNVLYVPKVFKKLLSVRAATRQGSTGVIQKDSIILRDAGGEQLVAEIHGNLYRTRIQAISPEVLLVNTDESHNINLWHVRFGHIHEGAIIQMQRHKSVVGLHNFDLHRRRIHGSRNTIFCDSCMLEKQTRKTFPSRSKIRAQTVGARLHVDICSDGTESVSKSKYFVLFKDEYSNYRHVYCIKTKDEAFDCIRKCVAKIRGDTGAEVRCLVSDCGSELISKCTQEYLVQNKISQELSAPFTPQQNGLIERDNRTVMEGARAMLFHRKLPEKLWGEAVNTMVYLLNRSVNRITGNTTPYQKYFGTIPNVSHLRVFGSIAMIKQQEKKRTGYQRKLEARSKSMIMVGYDKDYTYRLFDIDTDKVVITREAHFDEKKLQLRQNNTCF